MTCSSSLTPKKVEKSIYRLAKVWARANKDIEHYVHVKDNKGWYLQDRSKILAHWKQHCDEIWNVKFLHLLIHHGSATARSIPWIAPEEVRKALQCMKNNTAPDPNDLPADIW